MKSGEGTQVIPQPEVSGASTATERQWSYEKWFWNSDYLRWVLPELGGIGSGSRVLALGSGTGGLCRAIYPLILPDGEIVGLDADPEAVKSGNEYDATHGFDRIKLVAGDPADAVNLFGKERFDAVIDFFLLSNTKYPEGVRKVLAAARGALKPGGSFVTAEEDLPTIISGAFEVPGVEEAQMAWLRGLASGYAKSRGINVRIGPDVPTHVIEAGFRDLKIGTYSAPEWFPPFPDWQIQEIENFVETFSPGNPEMERVRLTLRAGGLDDSLIDHLAAVLGKWWSSRLQEMKRGEMPLMNHQIMLVTFARKPFQH